MPEVRFDPRYTEVERALADWRQGDCVLGTQYFVHRLDPDFQVTPAGTAVALEGGDLAESEVAGLVVASQTCDIVRSPQERPFIEVCPLIPVEQEKLQDVARGRYINRAFLPLLATRRLVADLDRVMTVEKPVVARWQRTRGWSTDPEGRAFAVALARKRVRFAFPDDFTSLVRKLQDRLKEKHGKDSPEGRALRALREIRVAASPSWDAESVSLTFWFVRAEEDVGFEGEDWSLYLERWLRLAPKANRFVEVLGQVVALEDLTAADYVNSDPLDLDYLSWASASAP